MSWLARASREAVRLVQPLIPRAGGGVTILIYHLVGAGTRSPVDVALDTFRAQMLELKESAQVCSLDDAVQCLQSGDAGSLPKVVITFDDGFDNFRTEAWPILQELAIPATLYVPVGFVEGISPVPLRGVGRLRPLDWRTLRALAADPLLTVGSHSWHHRDLRRLSIGERRQDLLRSRARLEDGIGLPVAHFCYPQAKRSEAAEAEVRAVYRTAVVAGGRRNVPQAFNPHRLWRVPVRRDMPVPLAPVLRSAVWLEEWAASRARALT